ncbi:MAG TPA: hypothetical protein VEE84_05225, partial [Burkholderiaceae bacterium]|nr:hypothetical protein [Burkholderiaceae bacterium]
MNENKTQMPVPDEEGISSVNAVKKPAGDARVYFGLAIACILIVGVATVLVTRYEARRKSESASKQAAS